MGIYNDLVKINVNEHTEKKNNLTYLSWAWAIDIIERYCDEHEFELNMGIDEEIDKDISIIKESGLVHTFVTINGKTKKQWLPIMDFKNKSIENPTSTDINKAYMRCLTKNISRWGLGMYIYAGEDLPEGEEPPKKISQKTWKELNEVYSKEEIQQMYAELGISKGSDLTEDYASTKIKERKDSKLTEFNNANPTKEFY